MISGAKFKVTGDRSRFGNAEVATHTANCGSAWMDRVRYNARKPRRWRRAHPCKFGGRHIISRNDTTAQWPIIDTFLAGERLDIRAKQLFADPDRQRLSALCYVEHDGRVLMLRRHKPPFAGYWTAPGGKLERGEQPREAIVREVREETQLTVARPRLHLIASETGADNYNWLLFFFRADPETTGVEPHLLKGSRETREGLLDWLPLDDLAAAAIPGVERMLLPYIFTNDNGPPHFARIRFDDNNEVVDMAVSRLHWRDELTGRVDGPS